MVRSGYDTGTRHRGGERLRPGRPWLLRGARAGDQGRPHPAGREPAASSPERAGVSYAYLSDIETGRGRPSSKALLAVAGALGRTPSELLQEAELYGALHEMATRTGRGHGAGVTGAGDRRNGAGSTRRRRRSAPMSPAAAARPRVPTREQLQRLARNRLAGYVGERARGAPRDRRSVSPTTTWR